MNNESGQQGDSTPNSEPPENSGDSSIALWMTLGFWVFMLGFGALAAHQYVEKKKLAKPPQWVSTAEGTGPAIAIESTRRGHYKVQGLINGQPVDFLVDTGATEVSIPEQVAIKLGLQRGVAGRAQTANGTATIFDTQIHSLSIGPLTRSNVPAHINPGMQGNQALLGMSFLRHFTLVQKGTQLQIQSPE